MLPQLRQEPPERHRTHCWRAKSAIRIKSDRRGVRTGESETDFEADVLITLVERISFFAVATSHPSTADVTVPSGHDCGTCRDGGHEAEMCALRMKRIANS